MKIASDILTGIIAVLHFYFLVLEMFLWTKPTGLRTFGNTPEKARDSAVLAANQGLYNGFLAAGLIWSIIPGSPGFPVKVFFLACVLIAGIYGGLTAKRSILYIQALPALIALILTVLAGA